LLGKGNEETAKLTYNYGDNLLRLRIYDEAESILLEALNNYEKIYGLESIELVPVLLDLGHVYANTNDSKTKKQLYRRAFKLVEQHYGDESAEFGWRSAKAGVDMLYLARDKEGEKHLRTGYKVLQSSLGEDHPRTGSAAHHLGKYEFSRKNYAAAKQYLLRALATFENPDEPSSRIELSAHAFLVRVYEELGDSESATQHSLAIGRMTPFESSQNYFPIYKRPPVYPPSALRLRKEGYVIVQYVVDKNGFVRNPRVIKVQGDKDFERPALDAVKKFRYAPRFIDGQAVAVKGVQNKFNFAIKH
jgi:TonB family protein